jgi:SNF2 family DNA or RNA helicase
VALRDKIVSIREADPQAKIVVFSQWSAIVQIAGKVLDEQQIGHVQITGDMTQQKRAKNLEKFQFDDETPVFLLSLRSGAVGLTLTAANHLILLDPCLNKATEEQALNRIYRIGQTRETHVHKIVVRNSLEEKIHDRSNRLDRYVLTMLVDRF